MLEQRLKVRLGGLCALVGFGQRLVGTLGCRREAAPEGAHGGAPEELEGEQGYNAAKGKYENLVNSGVIDPTKVVRYALQNASSIAGLMLTTEALISELPEKEEAKAGGAPGGMPPGMGDMGDF